MGSGQEEFEGLGIHCALSAKGKCGVSKTSLPYRRVRYGAKLGELRTSEIRDTRPGSKAGQDELG